MTLKQVYQDACAAGRACVFLSGHFVCLKSLQSRESGPVAIWGGKQQRGRGGGRGRGGPRKGRAKGAGDPEESGSGSEEEETNPRVKMAAQSANVGMLPPSDSEEESGEEKAAPAKKVGQPATAGMLPPSDSEEEETDSEEEEEEEVKKPAAKGPRPAVPDAPPKKKVEEEVDPEQLAKDMERLALIKKNREAARLKRIADEGWDRFSPESETNRRPDSVPTGRDLA
ncbi:hypothetical protein WJX72_007571 [[Myrmecia] bisecta]|uniref:Uncharacterized protein n=1 Tax=[Myrmecia] bisecta TaxID=41462 RepID=A0AAW1PG10_9CHLO